MKQFNLETMGEVKLDGREKEEVEEMDREMEDFGEFGAAPAPEVPNAPPHYIPAPDPKTRAPLNTNLQPVTTYNSENLLLADDSFDETYLLKP